MAVFSVIHYKRAPLLIKTLHPWVEQKDLSEQVKECKGKKRLKESWVTKCWVCAADVYRCWRRRSRGVEGLLVK